jgi:hypothetical protein
VACQRVPCLGRAGGLWDWLLLRGPGGHGGPPKLLRSRFSRSLWPPPTRRPPARPGHGRGLPVPGPGGYTRAMIDVLRRPGPANALHLAESSGVGGRGPRRHRPLAPGSPRRPRCSASTARPGLRRGRGLRPGRALPRAADLGGVLDCGRFTARPGRHAWPRRHHAYAGPTRPSAVMAYDRLPGGRLGGGQDLVGGALTGLDGALHVGGPGVAVSVPAQWRRPMGFPRAWPKEVQTPWREVAGVARRRCTPRRPRSAPAAPGAGRPSRRRSRPGRRGCRPAGRPVAAGPDAGLLALDEADQHTRATRPRGSRRRRP